jgi:hypothetical protein
VSSNGDGRRCIRKRAPARAWRPVAGAPGCPEGIAAVGFGTASRAPGCPEGIVAVGFETASRAPGCPEGSLPSV